MANAGDDNVTVLWCKGEEFIPGSTNCAGRDAPASLYGGESGGKGDRNLTATNLRTNNRAANYPVGNAPASVFCADLDGDGDQDIAVANQGSNNVSILKNTGNGTFAAATNYAVADSPVSVFCADLDGDGNIDIAVANKGSDNVSILKNNGDGTFQSAVNYPVGVSPTSIFCSDLDGDRDMDIAVANQGSGNISILRNNGDGTFQNPTNYSVGNNPTSVFCADLDGDGDMDIAVVDNYYINNIHILKNLTQVPANFPPQSFSLISPTDNDTTSRIVNYQWTIPYDPNLGDQIRYDLYKTYITFGASPETTVIIDSSLVKSWYTDTLEVGRYDWKVKAKDNWGAEVWSTQTWHFITFIRGDVRGDGTLDIGDVVMLLNYLYKDGSTPDPLSSGDVNCDYTVDVGDVVYLINYLFKSGLAPCS